MMAEIAGALTALNTARDIAKTLVDLRDLGMIQTKVIELQQAILSAQAGALSAQGEQSTLLQRIRELEEKMAELEAWDAEKEKYELTQVHAGTFAYTLKPGCGSTEPLHSLCSNCFETGHKSILQSDRRPNDGATVLRCHRCRAEVVASGPESSIGVLRLQRS